MENKYGFNAYDTIIALVLTQYLKERNYKVALGKIISGKQVSAPALAELLDRAVSASLTTLNTTSDPLMEGIRDMVKSTLTDFSGERYVQSMDAGFAEFLDDFLNDRANLPDRS